MGGNVDRPSPDELLKLAEAEEASRQKGKLKIFLGYSAGVGKTYAMLETARRIAAEGVDLVVGYVEPHKRPETEALLGGLESLPKKAISYRHTVLYEVDVDAILSRRPKIVIIDELAHTNATGSRHAKRFQDIEEILYAGIDVFTTLNIQHLESLNDVIAKVTGIAMRETVPDAVLDEAEEIEVVDLPIGDLLKRLKEGRVYLPEQAERATQNFFVEANLSALRELTLRRAAKRVGSRKVSVQGRSMEWGRTAAEKLLVCVTAYPSSPELVRAAKLLSVGLDAEWYAVYVETSGQKPLSEGDRRRLTQTLHLAEELNASPVTLTGSDVAQEIIRFARARQVTKILIGKPHARGIRDLVFGSVVDRLIRLSGDMDIYVISRSTKEAAGEAGADSSSRWSGCLAAIVLVGLATAMGFLVRGFLAPTNLAMFYLLSVVVAAILFGRPASVLASVLGVAAFDFFFVPPFLTFSVSDTEYLLTFAVLLIVGLLIATLAGRVRNQAESASVREAHTRSLFGLSRDLTGARDAEAVLGALCKHVRESLGADAVAFLNKEGLKILRANIRSALSDRERAVADWVAKNAEAAGRGTDTIPAAEGYYLPLKSGGDVLAVLGVFFGDKEGGETKLSMDRRGLIEALASQSAQALERVRLSEEAQRTRLLAERDKLQSALLNSISHDFRTPLVSITGSLSGMIQNPGMDDHSRRELLENAYEEAGRLNRLVGNLLDMARLEADAMRVSPVPSDIRDVIGTALRELEDRLSDRKVTVGIEEDLPLVPMDFSLIMKVLVNLIDNAIKYAPFGLPVDIDARRHDDRVRIRVLDRGLGIPDLDLDRVFNKFYRVQRPQNFEGTGLGLSICKGIVEAHHGRIWAENRPGGGTIVVVELPVVSA